MAPRKLIAGNWKMNGLRAEGLALAEDLAGRGEPGDCDLLVCPPATLLAPLAEITKDSAIALGGQDCHSEAKGAYTGDIAAAMLRDVGCSYVILGHSERRQWHHESDALIRAKAISAQAAGLTPIVCVGEQAAERASGQALETVRRQLDGSLPDRVEDLVVAYEPVWAIGTGATATPEDVAEMHASLRLRLVERFGEAGKAVRLLYGGSVKPENAGALLRVENVDGALIGGASLKAEDFWAIATSCPAV